MSEDGIHYPLRYDERINLPELGNYEVRVMTYDTFTCISCANWQTGQEIFHHDVDHHDEMRQARDLVQMEIRQMIPRIPPEA